MIPTVDADGNAVHMRAADGEARNTVVEEAQSLWILAKSARV